SLPAVEFYQTLECISNEIGGDLISTAWWRGVRLKDLLTMAGANPRTVKVVFHAADDYADSVPLAVALDPRAALVYQMNRALLPVEHGYPARILVPGRYGIKNVKWVTRIELVAEDFKGYWQQRGWTDDGRIHTMSRIDVPKDHALVNAGRTTIAGIAFAGDRGISRVQISVDEGKTWQDALLKPPLASLAWRLWQYQWDAPPGNGSIFVQATDGTGRVQWPLPQDTVPDGATGQDVHVVRVK
ncbi:MAG TPA: molybdopterin-dependent oxidoreductase, partial [Chloroflexota bacterium]|nr:molybdopterin-dependent oxidoreductase [Chloroflexota bacterium]